MKRHLKVILLAIFAGLTFNAQAQDPQFSQFYAAPMYHNPAFTGSGYAPRAIFNFRNQWPSLGANFITNVVSVDTYIDKFNSGVGVMFLNDQQGSARLKTTEFSGFYSYQAQLGDEHFLRAGLQATYSNRGFNPLGLTFGDQYDNTGFTGAPSGDPLADPNNINPVNFVDFSTGLLYFNPKAFLGVAVHHLTEPNMDFLGTNQGDRLPRKYTVNGGLNIPLANPYSNAGNSDKEFVLTPTFLYKQQGKFSQLDIGAYVTYTPLTLGLWYRGIPLKKQGTTRANHDALVALAGFRFDSFSIGYSYDLTISGLGASSGGAHEISVAYQFEAFEKEKNPHIRRRKKELSCPKF